MNMWKGNENRKKSPTHIILRKEASFGVGGRLKDSTQM